MISNKRILVCGGGGSVGNELVRQLAPKNKIFILDNSETETFDLTEELKQDGYWVNCRVGDIRDLRTVEDVFSDFKPQIIFHAAAYKHVTPMEWYPLEAIQTNILGTWNVMSTAKRWSSTEKFVFISTDKVVNSNSIMGATKRVGEIMVKNQGKGYVVVRFGNVLGSRGSLLPLWQNQMDRGKPLTVTDSRMERYFMSISQACNLVIEAARMGQGGEIIILDMGQPVNILNLAQAILRHSGGSLKEIGIRPGETLKEELMTEEEKKRAIRRGNFWIIK